MLSEYPDILTTFEVCHLLKISKNTLYKLIHSGQLKAKKIARHYRIPKSELLRFMDML
ncbi:MAG: helix-turn-helix domain-containing protein [Lachnospiraceae bacterium]|nr:helix-turn-helix domain-containing protein [Lachnospiraceae bacterium]